MFINNFDPVAFQIFSFEIRWYSLAYIVGILLGWFLSKKFFISDLKVKEKFDDYLTYLILGLIIGGRLGYVVFYNFEFYINNLLDIFKIWQGGMSFHGGVIGIIIASYLFAKRNSQSSFSYLDIVSFVAPIGIFFGRIANFINSELYGVETNVAWAVQFLVLLYFKNKSFSKRPGFISGIFLVFYSIFRFAIEFLRVPDDQLGYLLFNLTMGQLISIFFLIIGCYLLISKYENRQNS